MIKMMAMLWAMHLTPMIQTINRKSSVVEYYVTLARLRRKVSSQAKKLSLHLQYSIVMPTGATKGINNVYAEIYMCMLYYINIYARANTSIHMLVAIRCNIELGVDAV